MAELGRVAQAAIRSTTTSLVRATPIRCQPCHSLVAASSCPIVSRRNHMSTASSLRSLNSIPATSPSKTQQQSYSSFNWSDPTRVARPNADNIANINVRKPNRSSYDTIFGGAKDGDRKDNGNGKEGEDQVDYASDILNLELDDIQGHNRYKAEIPTAPRAYLRTVPRTGRTVHVKANVDVARSFKLLAMQVAQNSMRRDFQLQRFHERPGMKRKRLKSERWQKRFKKGFKATVARVRELTAQGW
ncbi:hypothetical protein F5B17DRAFT_379430 [Nemania serpens]|nr:hypothetical protein F5B17DRAFT_379430 [Nemania serpens]